MKKMQSEVCKKDENTAKLVKISAKIKKSATVGC